MTYEDLKKANATIKTTNIKGKEYAEVNERIRVFRMLYPEGKIETEIVELRDGFVLMRAIASDKEGSVLAVGHSYEKENSSFINKTSYIENCETSAVGRALGMLGIGINTSIASYEEVSNAMENQKAFTSPVIKCECCKNDVIATEKFSINRIVEESKKKYSGHIYCMNCLRAKKEKEDKEKEQMAKTGLPFPIE